MRSPNFVCPPDSFVFESFDDRAVVCQTVHGLPAVPEIADRVRASGNALHCVVVTLDRPLAEAHFPDGIEDVPLAVRCRTAGRYADLSRSLTKLRDFNTRFYLPADCQENITAIQMLSSLGLHCGVDFSDGPLHWEGLAELAANAILGRCGRATIEPFAMIGANFVPHSNLDWGRVLFDDPDTYLYLDRDGRIALTSQDLTENRFIAGSVVGFSPETCPELAAYRHRWRAFFRDYHPCASCPGWRLCLGRFANRRDQDPGCAAFFGELVDIAMEHHALKQSASGESLVWQP